MTAIATAPSISRYRLPRSASVCRSRKNTIVPMIGPSSAPMPPITTMKITTTVQSLDANPASGDRRSFCRKMNAPTRPVQAAVTT